MKIVTWNCNGAFRRKFNFIDEFVADIYVIQECENPIECNHPEYAVWAKNHLWIGDSKHKGLGVFAKEHINLSLLDWSNNYQGSLVKHFLSCEVNSQFFLTAVWTHYNNSYTFGYIGQFWKYLQLHKSNYKECLIVGDFNSNSIWDKGKRAWNHGEIIKELSQQNIESLYHFHTNEIQGKESIPTFFLQRNLNKPYHIDYIFGSPSFGKSLDKIEIGKVEDWIKLSDHLPMICKFGT